MHFYTLVVLPKELEEDDIESETMELLEKYRQDSEEYSIVEPEIYIKDFRKESKRIIDDIYKKNGDLKDIFLIDKYQKLFKEKKYKDIILDDIPYEEDDKGNLGYLVNPNSLFDWAVIGGRWNQTLQQEEVESDYDGYANKVKKNYCTIREYLKLDKSNMTPPAYIIYDDDYQYEPCINNERFKEFLQSHFDLDDILVVVDMHM